MTDGGSVCARWRGRSLCPDWPLQSAAQDQRIDWTARAPWGPQDHREPVELQKKDPYRMFDNGWQVGIQTATVWLLTSSAGHFLFDATADDTAHLVLDNIRKAGFNPSDIRYLIITHAHLDLVIDRPGQGRLAVRRPRPRAAPCTG